MSENIKLEFGLDVLRDRLKSAHGEEREKLRSRSVAQLTSQKSQRVLESNLPSIKRNLLQRNSSPQGISRDVSFWQEKVSKKVQQKDSKTLLKTIQGDSDFKMFDNYFLPLDIEEVEKMAGEQYSTDQFDINQQKFLIQCENLKKKATRYMQSRTRHVKNEGGYLFKTQTGLIQAHLPKFYKLLHYTKDSGSQCSNTIKALNNINDSSRAPSGRREVELLIEWLDYMLFKYITSVQPQSLDQKVRVAQLIYSLCYKELTRQISVHCIERGALLEKIWTAQVDLHSEHEDYLLSLVDKLRMKLTNILGENKIRFQQDLSQRDQIIAQLEKSNRKKKKKVKDLRADIFQLQDQMSQLKSKNQELRKTVELISKTDAFVKQQLKKSQQYKNEIYQSYFNANTQTFDEDFPKLEVVLKNNDEGDLFDLKSWRYEHNRPVVMFGYFDAGNQFHRTKMMERQNRFSDIQITEYADELLEIQPMKNKWTDTGDDLENDWTFIHNYDLQYLQERAILLKDYQQYSISTNCFYQIQSNRQLKSALLVGFKAIIKSKALEKRSNKNIQCFTEQKIKFTQTENKPIQKVEEDNVQNTLVLQQCQEVCIEQPIDLSPPKTKQVRFNQQKKQKSVSPVRRQTVTQANITKTTENVIKPLFKQAIQRQSVLKKPPVTLQIIRNMFAIDLIPQMQTMQQADVYQYIQILKILNEKIVQKEKQLQIHRAFPNFQMSIQQVNDFLIELDDQVLDIIPSLREAIQIISKLHNIVPDNIAYDTLHVDTSQNLQLSTQEYLDTDDYVPSELKKQAKNFANLISQNLTTEIQAPIQRDVIQNKALELKKSIEVVFQSLQPFQDQKGIQTDKINEIVIGAYAQRVLNIPLDDIFDEDYHPDPEFVQHIHKISIEVHLQQNSAIQQYLGQGYNPRNNFMYIKPLMRLINKCYIEKIIKCMENPTSYKNSAFEVLQSLIGQRYGLKHVVDDNMSRVIKGIQLYQEKYHRVLLFSKFLGIYNQNYSTEDFNFYLNCIEFLWFSSSGNNVYNDDTSTENVSGYQRILNCTELYFKDKLTDEMWNQLIQTLETLKIEATKNDIDKIDTDLSLEILLNYYKQLKLQLSQYLEKKLEKQYQMFSLILKEDFLGIVQPLPLCKMTMKELSNVFKIHAIVIKERRLAIRWETLLSIILDNAMITSEELL